MTAWAASLLVQGVPATAAEWDALAAPVQAAAYYGLDLYTAHHMCEIDDPEGYGRSLADFGALTGTAITHKIHGDIVVVTATKNVRLGIMEGPFESSVSTDLSSAQSQYEYERSEVCALLAAALR